jgi:DNA-binding response OmpR family regulator
MSKILLIDDDPFVVEAYSQKMRHAGYDVEIAIDGMVAVKMMRASRPDLVIMDLMLPQFSGFELLNLMKKNSELTGIRTIVLSNFYLGDPEREAAASEADATLQKSTCTATLLLEKIRELLPPVPKSLPLPSTMAPAAPAAQTPPIAPAAPITPASPATPATPATPTPPPARSPAPSPSPRTAEPEMAGGSRKEFLKNASVTLATLRQMNDSFIETNVTTTRKFRLLNFYRKVHFVTAMAGLLGFKAIALEASAFEALLLKLHDEPDDVRPSTLQTIAYTLDFLRLLFDHAEDPRLSANITSKVLVVDDDAVSVRALAAALTNAQLQPLSFQDPGLAMKKLEEETFGLVLLDIEMPGIDGFEFCRKLRSLPQYKKTPVIFVTGHNDFESRINSVLSGGDDLIAKPVFPIELAVKAVTHLLRNQIQGPNTR